MNTSISIFIMEILYVIFIFLYIFYWNDILAELIPSLRDQNQRRIIELLGNIEKLDISIDWDQIMEFQFQCLKNGLNGIGTPDLIIAQNAKQNHCSIYTFDRHFKLMQDILKLQLAE
jgi:predicted nucleic acid-binding protein